MKRSILILIPLLVSGFAVADDVSKSSKLICSASKVMACFESGQCTEVLPYELNIPQFLVVDLKKSQLSTTRASGENRSSPIKSLDTTAEAIILQGVEDGRAFSFTIDKLTGLLSVAVARDGITASVFGACTDAQL